MRRNCFIALAALLVSIMLWIIEIVFVPSNNIVFVGAILSTIICIGFSLICIVNRISAKASPYLVFAITDIIIGVFVTIYSVYDIHTDKGIMAGLLGFILLLFVVPCSVVLLVIDVVVWIINRRK